MGRYSHSKFDDTQEHAALEVSRKPVKTEKHGRDAPLLPRKLELLAHAQQRLGNALDLLGRMPAHCPHASENVAQALAVCALRAWRMPYRLVVGRFVLGAR